MRNPYTMELVCDNNKFYDRWEIVEEILSGKHKRMLIIGARKMGKTSLLKRVEYELDSTQNIGVYISLDGLTTEGFKEWFEYASFLKYESFEKIGLDVGEVFSKSKDVFMVIRKLDANLKRERKYLFWLFDEAEALANLENEFLQDLRDIFEIASNIRLILSASENIRELEKKSADWLAPPFLHDAKRYFLGPLDDSEAEALIRQTQSGLHIDVSDRNVAKIQQLTGNHPFLIQFLCGEFFKESGRLIDVSNEHLDIVYNKLVTISIMKDSYKNLSFLQQKIITCVSKFDQINVSELSANMMDSEGELLNKYLGELTALGYIKKSDEKYSVSNYFCKRWLKSQRTRR